MRAFVLMALACIALALLFSASGCKLPTITNCTIDQDGNNETCAHD